MPEIEKKKRKGKFEKLFSFQWKNWENCQRGGGSNKDSPIIFSPETVAPPGAYVHCSLLIQVLLHSHSLLSFWGLDPKSQL